MPPYPSHTSCTLSVDTPWSQNAIIILFDDILNGTATKTINKYIKMVEYLSSLLPTASTKVSATCGNVQQREARRQASAYPFW